MAFRYLAPDRARDDERNIEVVRIRPRGPLNLGPSDRPYELRSPSLTFEFIVGTESKRTDDPNALSILVSAHIYEEMFRHGLIFALFRKAPGSLPGFKTKRILSREEVLEQVPLSEEDYEGYKRDAREGIFELLVNWTNSFSAVAPDFTLTFHRLKKSS